MVLAFSGGMGAGKSTAIKFVEDFFGSYPINIKFAQPLYDLQELAYRRISQVYTRPPTFVKDRKLLQWLGTEWGRESIHKDIWLMLWKAEVLRSLEKNPKQIIVCDDVRFDNEAAIVKDMGGYIIRIDRQSNVKAAEGGEGIKNHSSEAGIDKKYIDFEVSNNDTVSKFQSSLFECYGKIKADLTPKIVF